eukprot:353524_1
MIERATYFQNKFDWMACALDDFEERKDSITDLNIVLGAHYTAISQLHDDVRGRGMRFLHKIFDKIVKHPTNDVFQSIKERAIQNQLGSNSAFIGVLQRAGFDLLVSPDG